MDKNQLFQTLLPHKDHVVVEHCQSGYAHTNYIGYIKKECPHNFTRDELLLLLDRGSLPFGGRGQLAPNDGRDRRFNVCVHDD
ncbi:hypothetical protein [Paenibacillus cymbidii]|uniref:hypothetical protein n=1 Tax=Paenibacillus cymbidii TaxID=1639034 RepID=UPI0010810913|nr:hypothetical protein [Paenibacillus cymbidii]